MQMWNPWHGCHKISPGCLNCYVYRRDEAVGRDASVVARTASFDLPARKKRDGSFRLTGGEVFTCGTSDFFLPEADPWRAQAWRLIAARPDCRFLIITQRIERFHVELPEDWGAGYANVTIGCTAEDQARADSRLPVFLQCPIAHRVVICEPLLEAVDLSRHLSPLVERVVAGGESGPGARPCRYEWLLALREQCARAGVGFAFKQTGLNFYKDGRHYEIPRRLQMSQARKANINLPRRV